MREPHGLQKTGIAYSKGIIPRSEASDPESLTLRPASPLPSHLFNDPFAEVDQNLLLFQTLISLLWQGGHQAYLWIPKQGHNHSYWQDTTAPISVPPGRHNIYFGIHPTAADPEHDPAYTPSPAKSGKPRAVRNAQARSQNSTVCAVNCLFAEFDAKDYDDGLDGAWAAIEAVPLSPSVVVFSGGGYHCYWLLRDTFHIQSLGQRRFIDQLQKRWVDFVGSDPGAKDLARMLRVPGTHNYKAEYAPNYPLVRFVRAEFDRLYTLDEMEAILPEIPKPQTARPYSLPASATGQDRQRQYVRAVLENQLGILARASVGHRNRTLFTAAFKLGQFVGIDPSFQPEVEAALYATARAIGLNEGEIAATIHSGINRGIAIPPTNLPDFDSPAASPKTIAQVVERFPGEDLNYYPDGIPLTVIKLLNGLHTNKWVHVAKNDVRRAHAFVALWVVWHLWVLAGELDPLAPVSEASLTGLMGLTKDTVRNGLDWGEYGGFLSPYKSPDNSGKKSHQNTRGRPARYYVFRPLGEVWELFMSTMEPLMWRALLVTHYPDLPAEALAIADLLTAHSATEDDIAAIDDVSYPLYDHHADAITDAIDHLRWRVDVWWNEYIFPADPTPLRLPEGATFSNAARFRDQLNNQNMDDHDGKRKGKDRYRIADLTGRSMPAHRASNKRLGIACFPDWRDHPVTKNGDIVAQCQAISQKAYEWGNIRICAPNGETIRVSPGRARSFDYDRWLAANGGRDGARIQYWEYGIEKRESLLTDDEKAERDAFSQQQAAISARRQKGRTTRPSAVEAWLVKQGELRAALFGMQRIQDRDEPPLALYIGVQGDVVEARDIWRGILQSVQLGQTLPSVAYIPQYTLVSGETLTFTEHEANCAGPDLTSRASRKMLACSSEPQPRSLRSASE